MNREKVAKARELLEELLAIDPDELNEPEDMTEEELNELLEGMTIMLSLAKKLHAKGITK